MENRFKEHMVSAFEKKAIESYIEMSDGTELRYLHTEAPEETTNGYNLVLLPGWGSVPLGWDDVLLEAIKDFNIFYIESREKFSSKNFNYKTKNDLERFSSDLKECLDSLNLSNDKTILCSSSFGCVVLADALRKNKVNFEHLVFIAPAIRIDLPLGMRYLIPFVPAFTMYIVKPIIRWWLKKRKSESPIQAAKYIRVMNEAEPKKWKNVTRHFLYWTWYDVYAEVDDNILLIAAEEDKMHEADITKRIHDSMRNSVYKDLVSNLNTHSKPLVDELRKIVGI